jgi:hypothetical protein
MTVEAWLPADDDRSRRVSKNSPYGETVRWNRTGIQRWARACDRLDVSETKIKKK